MQFRLVIESNNAQMRDASDVAKALSVIVRRLMAGDTAGGIRDSNGNSVGSFEMLEE